MAIVSGTVSSAPVGAAGTTVSAPADDSPLNGWGIVGNKGNWVMVPGPFFAVTSSTVLGTVTTAVTVDWRLAGYFTFTLTTTDSCAVSFTGADGVLSPTFGQVIRIGITDVTGTGTATTWPSTVVWEGGVIPGATPAAGLILVELTCVGASAYLGTVRAMHS